MQCTHHRARIGEMLEHVMDRDQVVACDDVRGMFDEADVHIQSETFAGMLRIPDVRLETVGARAREMHEHVEHLATTGTDVQHTRSTDEQRTDPRKPVDCHATRAQHVMHARLRNALVLDPIGRLVPVLKCLARRLRMDEDQSATAAQDIEQWATIPIRSGHGREESIRAERTI
jgi:hypothetical protein